MNWYDNDKTFFYSRRRSYENFKNIKANLKEYINLIFFRRKYLTLYVYTYKEIIDNNNNNIVILIEDLYNRKICVENIYVTFHVPSIFLC